MSTADRIYEIVKPLPEPLAREVLDFAEFLRTRVATPNADDLTTAQAVSMSLVWDNPDDEVWNDAARG